MAIMISEVYDVFLRAGALEIEARETTAAISAENLSTKDDITSVK